MRLKIQICLILIIALVAFIDAPAFAKPLTRGEVSKIVREGEYHSNGKRIQRKSVKKRKPASTAKKDSKVRKNSKKKNKNKRTARARSRDARLPYAKETPNERDMPFISVPKSRVRKKNKTIVMEDPGAKSEPLSPALTEPLDTSEPKAERVLATDAESPLLPAAREPDAFDTHSGADPMQPTAPAVAD